MHWLINNNKQLEQDLYHVREEESYSLLVLRPNLFSTHECLNLLRLKEFIQPTQVPKVVATRLGPSFCIKVLQVHVVQPDWRQVESAVIPWYCGGQGRLRSCYTFSPERDFLSRCFAHPIFLNCLCQVKTNWIFMYGCYHEQREYINCRGFHSNEK